jgi:hypothetical protein
MDSARVVLFVIAGLVGPFGRMLAAQFHALPRI